MAGNNGRPGEPDPLPGALEEFWANILSEDPPTVRKAWGVLSAEEKSAVYRHLRRMASEEGWHPSQRDAARAALQAISPYTPAEES